MKPSTLRRYCYALSKPGPHTHVNQSPDKRAAFKALREALCSAYLKDDSLNYTKAAKALCEEVTNVHPNKR